MADMHSLKLRDVGVVREVFPEVLDALTEDVEFLKEGFKAASDHFEKKARLANCPEETLKEANWEVFILKILS